MSRQTPGFFREARLRYPRCLLSLLAVQVSIGLFFDGGPRVYGAEAPPKIAAFLKQCETSRRGAIAQLEHSLRGLQSQDASPETAGRIAKIQADLRALRANKEPVVAPLAFPPERGAIGRLPRLHCHVNQVLSDREMLVECYFPLRVSTVRHFQPRAETIEQAVTFLVRGVSTEGAEEGADLEVLDVLEVLGKQTYKTVDGSSRSVWVLGDFDMHAVEPYFRQAAAQR
jgi:hypothetical protein